MGDPHLAETFREGGEDPGPLEMEPGRKILMADSLESRGSSWLFCVRGKIQEDLRAVVLYSDC